MMPKFDLSQPVAIAFGASAAIAPISGTILSLMLLTAPMAVLAHAGHGDEFHQAGSESTPASSIQVDTETAQRLGIKTEPAIRKRLDTGIKTTGQIETLPNQKVEVTPPVSGTVVELLVKPGDRVSKGQPVAVLSSAELSQMRVESVQKRAEAEADLKQAIANFQLAEQNLKQQGQITVTDIEQARIELIISQEQYDRDRELLTAGAIPRRQVQASQAHLAVARATFTKAASRRDVLEAEAQLKRAQAGVEVAQSRVRLSSAGYEARLQQLGTLANNKGLVTVIAPISGTVADRGITPGESVNAADKPLMSILNDDSVFATANIYEKDLDRIQIGQKISVKVASLPNRTFTGRITFIGSAVTGETRVVPVKAELENSQGLLKPGMFAELQIFTNRTANAVFAIPNSAVVEANGQKVIYVQNGDAFQSVEVTLGQTSGDMVEVKSGLFDGDLVVTQRATQLYAQSLRNGGKAKETTLQVTNSQSNNGQFPWWLVLPIGGAIALGASVAIAVGTFWAGTVWASRRRPTVPVSHSESNVAALETEVFLSNSKQSTLSHSVSARKHEDPQQPHF